VANHVVSLKPQLSYNKEFHMQKKLIALAIAGLSGAAFAQSNVTIYGVMDATYDNVSATGASVSNAGAAVASLPGRGRTTFNSSYIGFKGVESLGNGLAVAFQIEQGLSEQASTGSFGTFGAAGTGAWATRDSYVGLAGGFGTIAFGNLTGPTRALGAALDVNAGATGIGANTALLGKLGGGSGAGYFDQRIANAIAYISPTMGGFSGVLGYLPNENRGTDNAGGVTNGQANMHAWTAGLTYANGPVYVGLAYTTVKDDNANSTGSGFAPATYLANAGVAAGALLTNATPIQKYDNTRLGGKYDFGMGTVGLLWDRSKATVGGFNGATAQQTVWYLPVTFNVGSGKIIAAYGKSNNVTGTLVDTYNTVGACSAGTSCDYASKQFTLGYEYSMSKRTTIKAVWSQITNSKDAGNDFLYGVSAPNSTATGASAAGVAAGADPRGLSIGLRHSF
jgi:predicted porin